jgi:hypothetical protein
MIEFKDWLPDQPAYLNKGVTTALNCYPSAVGYRSVNAFQAVSGAATNKIAGVFAAKDNNGNVKLFAGDATKLYVFGGAGNALVDASKAGGYNIGASGRWRSTQFGDKLLVAGGTGEEVQKWQLGTDTSFSDLSASCPNADFITVVRDQVWVASIDDGSGKKPSRVQWSGINDETSWTVGTDQSDFQEIPDAGNITGLCGGQNAVILMERAIAVASYVGSPLIYQIDRVETARGCAYSGSVAQIGGLVFFLAEDGFYAFDGSKSQPIGAEKVNRFFLNDMDLAYTSKMSAAVDPTQQVVAWSYVSNASPDGEPDRMIVFNYTLGRWSLVEVGADIIAPFFTSGQDLESLDALYADIDAVGSILDSHLFKGGSFVFGGAYQKKLHAFSGAPIAATFETAEFPVAKDKHALVTRTVPHFTGGSVSMQVGARDRHDDPVVFDAGSALTDEGFCEHRVQGRFHRAKMTISGNWENAQGLDIEGRALGRR